MSSASLTVATDGCPINVDAAAAMSTYDGLPLPSFSARCLSWENAANEDQKWDVIIFADALYNFGVAAVLSKAISSLLKPGGAVYGAVGVHRRGSYEIFKQMQLQGFAAQEIQVTSSTIAVAHRAAACLSKATGNAKTTNLATN